MRRKDLVIMLTLLLAGTVFPKATLSQASPQKANDEQPLRISTELVQVDVVVTDKAGKVVRGLTKDDFELSEKGKKQQISFFEFVEAGKSRRPGDVAKQSDVDPSPQGLSEAEVKRIFGFIVDDLTIPYQDLVYVRQMLTNFVDNQMQPTDLVAIVRTVGGKGVLQQFTSDKELLRRAIASLTVATHPFTAFNTPAAQRLPANPLEFVAGGGTPSPSAGPSPGLAGADVVADFLGEAPDISSALDDTNKMLRSYMSLSTASFVVDSLRQLPGRKSLVLISGGLPIIGPQQASVAGNLSNHLNQLTDKATRAGVAIHTMDIRGLQVHAVASFADTPGRSAMGVNPGTIQGQFGRVPDKSLFGDRNPFDQIAGHQGLRALAYATGGIPVLNKNDFNEGLGKIIDASEAYYLLAYTPSDAKFDGDFRKLDIKVKRDGLKVYNRRGYIAREDKPSTAPTTKQDQLLAAVKSPLARRDIELDAMLLYKAASAEQGAIDIHLFIEAKKLTFEEAGDKQQANYDVAGFIFDVLGEMRGGFSETITVGLTPQELNRARATGFSYSANTSLSPGIYQVRLAARDNKTGNIGTLSRYLEVPNLSKGKLAASSLLIGAVPVKDTSQTDQKPIPASRRISRSNDLRYATIIYNAKLKDGKPQVRTQLIISHNGQVIYKPDEEPLVVTANNPQSVLKVGQLGLSGVKPGRYTMTLVIIDTLAEKKAQTISRSMDFLVVN
ncbi:MAG TPA: VWA domain-containing protein [Blastocatellia bacterium]|nr:VWA domain-containing protein [Blastocatellia bacterium]